ncbi:MAG: phosphate uptake regulator PhoU [Candidatus Bathyarchaeota archaeon]|nr:phosphate uptake regulator PhoU [Candidatus Bathyarchaeota archaeon]
MDKRRIQLVGRSTLTVSLPSKWIKDTSLNKGDFVTVIPEKDGALRIVQDSITLEKEALRTCTINSDLCQENSLLERVIVACYIKGFESIKIISSSRISKKNLQSIRDAELKLMGLGIVEETSSSVTLQCSINPTIFPIDLVTRRLYTLFSTMCDESIQALMNSNEELAKEAQGREREANIMYALILRLLNQAQLNSEISKEIGIHSSEDVLNIFIVANAVERMADWAYKIADDVIKIETSGVRMNEIIRSSIADYSKKIMDICDKAMKSEFAYDVDLANMVINQFRGNLDEEACNIIDDLLHKNIFHGFGELRQIICALRRIGEISVTIAETSMDRAIEKNKICSV